MIMSNQEIHAVTGAFGYSGRYIASLLLEQGLRVRTLTNKRESADIFGNRVEAFPLDFAKKDDLARTLDGVSVLYNTYWVRFNHRSFSFGEAVKNTLVLFEAAKRAGVKRVVHVSITNPSEDSPFEYFRGKATLEKALQASGVSHAILRPAVLFGGHDILINNIAWAIRRLPVFGAFGNGQCRIQPIHVQDFAELAVECGQRSENVVVDAIGPETFTFRALVRTIAETIGKWRPIIPVPPTIAYLTSRVLGALVGDVFLTRDEIAALMADLLHVEATPTGHTRLTEWARQNATTLGVNYASELARRTLPR